MSRLTFFQRILILVGVFIAAVGGLPGLVTMFGRRGRGIFEPSLETWPYIVFFFAVCSRHLHDIANAGSVENAQRLGRRKSA